MGTALLKTDFSDLVRQLVFPARGAHGARTARRRSPALPAGIDTPPQQAGLPEDMRCDATNGAVAPGDTATELVATARVRDVIGAPPPAGNSSRPTSSRRMALARRAQAYLAANVDQPFSLRQLSELTRCSERALQYAFRDVYGMPPHAWFLAMKLTEVNRQLRGGDCARLRVSDVALHWGFTHFGRFATDYRRMFGESPSTTLKRGSQGRGTW